VKAARTLTVTRGDLIGLGSTVRRGGAALGLVPICSTAILTAFVLTAIFAGYLSPYNPTTQDLGSSGQPPMLFGGSGQHVLGTDVLGRDVLARLIYGTRVSLTVAAAVIFLGATFGSALGIIAGYFGRVVDAALMRFVDIVLSLPTILVAIVAASTIGASLQNVILIIAALTWPAFARQVRAEVLGLRVQDYITLARVAGLSDLMIVVRHIVPNVLPLIVVFTTLRIGGVILVEATLSFLGVGVPPPTPTWGIMVSDGRSQLQSMWWISFFPGLTIALTVLSFNMLGDWLRDASDPKTRGSRV
jgi:peptide/nickel transport system permease protein